MDKKRVKMIPSRLKAGSTPSSMSVDIENTSSSESDCEVVHVSTFKTDVNSRRHVHLPSKFPLTIQDLAVHKTKVDAVQAWLIEALANKNSGLLLLTGPTGSGKTATLQAVAAANNVNVMEWTTPMDDFYENTGHLNQNWTSQTERFEEFLIFGSRYSSVMSSETTRKLILVEDFPNAFLMNPAPFHEIVRMYAWMGKCPLVFISTTVNTGTKISRDLFPEKLLVDLKFKEISFNAVATSFMVKAVDRMARLEDREDIAKDVREAICHAASGDVRNAAQMWAFHTQVPLLSLEPRPSKITVPTQSRKRKGAGKRKSGKDCLKSDIALLDCKDPVAGMLPSIARVLYAKREATPAVGCSTDLDERGFFKSNPQDIVDQFTSDQRCFVGMCHENYLTIFSNLTSICLASEQLSVADLILGTASWDNDLLKEIGFSVAVRGLMNACDNPISKWNPLSKDKWPHISQQTAKHLQRVRETYGGTTLCTTQDLVMDVFPSTLALRNQPYLGFGCSRLADEAPQSPIPHITDTDSDAD